MPVAHRRRQILEHRRQFRRDVAHPALASGFRARPVLLVPDRQEAFLEGVRLAQQGELLEPSQHPGHSRRVEIVLPLEQQKALVLELEPLAGREIPPQAFSELLDSVIGHALNMEPVHHDAGLGQRCAHDLAVDVVHVHRHPLHAVLVA